MAAPAAGQIAARERVLRTRLLVIGAGPHALALVARLRAKHVDVVDNVTRRWHESSVVDGDRCVREVFACAAHEIDQAHARSGPCSVSSDNLMVVDPAGTWMEQWRSQFASLRIPFLRSIVTAHPDPHDGACARSRSRVGPHVQVCMRWVCCLGACCAMCTRVCASMCLCAQS